MRALVVYESMFGNTETIARAIAAGLATSVEVTLAEVGVATTSPEVDLLVVGGPTHAFGMTRATTREDAASRTTAPVISDTIGIREWLDRLGPIQTGLAATTFDTRIAKPRVPGSAASGALKRLRRRGAAIAAPAHSFYVSDVDGPLVDGEVERASAWGAQLGARLAAQQVVTGRLVASGH